MHITFQITTGSGQTIAALVAPTLFIRRHHTIAKATPSEASMAPQLLPQCHIRQCQTTSAHVERRTPHNRRCNKQTNRNIEQRKITESEAIGINNTPSAQRGCDQLPPYVGACVNVANTRTGNQGQQNSAEYFISSQCHICPNITSNNVDVLQRDTQLDTTTLKDHQRLAI